MEVLKRSWAGSHAGRMNMKRALLIIGFSGPEVYSTHSNKKHPGYRKLGECNDARRIAIKRRVKFWDQPNLDCVLLDAKRKYKAKAIELHPDNNGDHDLMVLLNQAWVFIKAQFSRRGINLD